MFRPPRSLIAAAISSSNFFPAASTSFPLLRGVAEQVRCTAASCVFPLRSSSTVNISAAPEDSASSQRHSTPPQPKSAPLKPLSTMPSESTWEALKSLSVLLRPSAYKRAHELMEKGTQRAGRIGYYRVPTPFVAINDPELAEKALRNEGITPARSSIPGWVAYRRDRALKFAILSGNKIVWKKARSVIAGKILPPRHVQGFESAMLEVMDDQIENLTRISTRHAALDPSGRKLVKELPNEMYKWAMESVGTVLFETRLGCLQDPVPEKVQSFIDAIADMFATTMATTILFPLQKRLGTHFVKRHFAAWDAIFAFVAEVVAKRKDELIEKSKHIPVSKSEGAVLTYLLLEETLDDEEIYANVTELLLAGVDTTSNTLVWTLYELAKNPQHLRRLEEEIERVIGDDRPSVKAIHKMPFLKWCVKETLRLYPVVLEIHRRMKNDIELDGYLVPKKTVCSVNFYRMSRNPLFFDNPKTFDPTRWDRESGKAFHPYCSVPFGAGLRSCIGKRIAEMEMHLMLARIVQKFRFRLVEDLPEVKPIYRTLLIPPPDETIPVEFTRK